jgi:hypothetical protein
VTSSVLALLNVAGVAGGGVFNDVSGSLTLTGTVLSGNSAGSGGGLANFGTASIVGGGVTGNMAGVGGGIANFGLLGIAGTVVSGNTPDDIFGLF